MKKLQILFILIFVTGLCSAEKVTNMQMGGDSSTEGLWHFNKGSGSTAYDVSGNGNNGAITDALWVNGLWGSCLEFDGSGDYVKIDDSPSLSFGDGSSDSPVSWSAWIRCRDVAGSRFIVAKDDWPTSNNNEWSFFVEDGKLVLILLDHSTSGNIIIKTIALISTNIWYYVVATYNGEGSGDTTNVKLYIDGILRVNDRFTSSNYTAMEDKAEDVYIGARLTSSHYFDGRIEEVSIVNRVISAAEIVNNYSRQIQRH